METHLWTQKYFGLPKEKLPNNYQAIHKTDQELRLYSNTLDA